MVVVVYTSSASANTAVRNKQKAILDFLILHKIEFEEIDLCVHTDAKDVMRSKIPEDIKKEFEANKKPLIPPQVFNDDSYCGDYDMFFNAREMELLHTFFKVPPTPKTNSKMNPIDWEKTSENSKNETTNICEKERDRQNGNDSEQADEVIETTEQNNCDVTEPVEVKNVQISDASAQEDDNCDITSGEKVGKVNGTEALKQTDTHRHLVSESASGEAETNVSQTEFVEDDISNLKLGIESNGTDQEECNAIEGDDDPASD